MTLVADGMLVLATVTLAIYCMVISKRLRALGRMDRGVGAAIASLAQSTEDARAAVASAQTGSQRVVADLSERTARAEQAAGRLELLLATLHNSETGTAQPISRPQKPAPKQELRDVYRAMGR